MNKQTIIAVNRFGLGARPGELSQAGDDYRRWLMQQVEIPAPAAVSGAPVSASTLREVESLRMAMRGARKDKAQSANRDTAQAYGKLVRSHYLDQVHARYSRAATTDRPFFERLALFWSNHFAISTDKQPLPAIAGAFENETVRQHVGGNFYDMLVSVEQHPAMLLYLDNRASIGPNSRFGKRSSKRADSRFKGLNENLAREILELHTLGVDGGYTQEDVTSLARVITGWSVGTKRFDADAGSFVYRDAAHEPGKHEVLGRRYAQTGVRQGEAVLQDLAMHPSTARHVSFKLARHFIADDPPADVVDNMTRAWLATDGRLLPVYAAMIDGIEACKQVTAKYKSPQDFVISTLRALEQSPRNGQWTVNALDLLGQRPFQPGSPAGWPDTADHWGGADALYKRIEWADAVARQNSGKTNPVQLADAVLGSAFADHSRTVVSRAESASEGLTLLLASPGFQRR
ncbi:MAG: DUF1800 family protein [Pseudomonadota bacterium]